mgnify:FL=1
MAIFYSIVEDNVVPSASILCQISSLVSLNLLAQVTSDDQIDCPKYKCLVNFQTICDIAKQLKFEIMHYLYDFVWGFYWVADRCYSHLEKMSKERACRFLYRNTFTGLKNQYRFREVNRFSHWPKYSLVYLQWSYLFAHRQKGTFSLLTSHTWVKVFRFVFMYKKLTNTFIIRYTKTHGPFKVCCQCTLGTWEETCEVVRSYVVAIFPVCKQISSKALPICYVQLEITRKVILHLIVKMKVWFGLSVVVSSSTNLKTPMGREERGYTLGGSLLSWTSSGSKSPSRLSDIRSLRRPPCWNISNPEITTLTTIRVTWSNCHDWEHYANDLLCTLLWDNGHKNWRFSHNNNNNLTVFGRWILGGGEYTKLTPVIFEKEKMSGIYLVPKSLKSGRLRLCH